MMAEGASLCHAFGREITELDLSRWAGLEPFHGIGARLF